MRKKISTVIWGEEDNRQTDFLGGRKFVDPFGEGEESQTVATPNRMKDL